MIPAGLVAFFATPFGAFILKWFVMPILRRFARRVGAAILVQVRRAVRIVKQNHIDKINRENYKPVETGELSNAEDIQRTEDALSGRTPRNH